MRGAHVSVCNILRLMGLQYDYIPFQNGPCPQAMIVNPREGAKLCRLKQIKVQLSVTPDMNQGDGIELTKSHFTIRYINGKRSLEEKYT